MEEKGKLKRKAVLARRVFGAIIGLLAVTLCSNLATTPVRAYISNYYWVVPFYRGYDEFYGSYVSAYETNSTAQLMVNVYNDWYSYPSINVTAVKVVFDWSQNYSSIECPYIMPQSQSHSFKIDFTVPSTDVASNVVPHSYVIYVEFTYDSSTSYWSYYPSEYFAVYSSDQADARDLYINLNAKLQYIPSFHSYEAQMLLSETAAEANVGYYIDYRRGEFDLAKAHFETALSLFDQAFAVESDYAKAYDENYMASLEAALNVTKLQAEAAKTQADAALAEATASLRQADAAIIEANATKTQADAALAETDASMKRAEAAMTEADAAMIEANAAKTQAEATTNAFINQSYAWILFGIGFVIIGIGTLVYAIRKPKIPKTP